MLKAKHFFALVVVAAALVLFAAYSLKEGESIPQSGNAMFPGLLERIPDVVRVDVMSEGRKFVLETVGDGRWTAPERGSFPLDADKVHQLLVGAAALNRIEPKTSKPELYAQLGVGDPFVNGLKLFFDEDDVLLTSAEVRNLFFPFPLLITYQ